MKNQLAQINAAVIRKHEKPTPSATADKIAHTPEAWKLSQQTCADQRHQLERLNKLLNARTAQRDELLEACKRALPHLGQTKFAFDVVSDAIAKAEGNQ